MFVSFFLFFSMRVYVCVCIVDWFEKVHPHWEKIMYMYKQIQKKRHSSPRLLFFFSIVFLSFFFFLYILSLFSIKFVYRIYTKKKEEIRQDKANWIIVVVASIDIRLASTLEHFISTSSNLVRMHLLDWN